MMAAIAVENAHRSTAVSDREIGQLVVVATCFLHSTLPEVILFFLILIRPPFFFRESTKDGAAEPVADRHGVGRTAAPGRHGGARPQWRSGAQARGIRADRGRRGRVVRRRPARDRSQ